MSLDLKKISGWSHDKKVTVKRTKSNLLVVPPKLNLPTPNINIFLNNHPIPQ